MPSDTPETRRLAAIMFTDMVGFSALSQRDEPLAIELLDIQRQIVRLALAAHRGREVKASGDGFLLCFDSAVDAVRCAVEIQTNIIARNGSESPDRRFQIRIGIHVGDVIERDGDLIGDGVNVASRIEPLAAPGGICVTGPVYDQVRNKIDHPLAPLGRPDLKNIEFSVAVYRVELPGAASSPLPRPAGRSRHTGFPLVPAMVLLMAIAAAAGVWKLRSAPGGHASPRPPAGSGGPIRSLAVLPLKNWTGDAKQEFFTDGITDSLITDLSHIRALRVVSFQSTQRYKGEHTKQVPEIARELSVDAVLEGSVQKSGGTVLIKAQLVRAMPECQVWSQTFERDAGNVLNAQNEIVLAIATAIQAELTPEERKQFSTPRTINPESQSHYFLGRFRFGQGDFAGAIDEYQRAVKTDPEFAAAYAGIADSYGNMSSVALSPHEAMPKAEAAAHKAIELDPRLAEAHAALGYVDLFYHWNRDEGEREFKKAIELNPGYPIAHVSYALLLMTQHRFEEALQQLRTAESYEPRSALTSNWTEWALFLKGDYVNTVAQAKHTLSLQPKMWLSHAQMGLAYLYLGKTSDSLRELKLAADKDQTSVNVTYYAYALGRSGKRAEAEAALRHFLEANGKRYVCAYEVACAYEGLNKREEAIRWLNRGVNERCDCLMWGGVEPWMADLQKDMRYKAIQALVQ